MSLLLVTRQENRENIKKIANIYTKRSATWLISTVLVARQDTSSTVIPSFPEIPIDLDIHD